MHANGFRDAAQELLDHLAEDDVEGAKVAYEQYFQLYGQIGCKLREHLVANGLARAAYECSDRLWAKRESASIGGVDFSFLDRLAENYSPTKERLLADVPA